VRKSNSNKSTAPTAESSSLQPSRRAVVKGIGIAGGVALASPVIANAPAARAADKVKINISTWMGFEPGRHEAWQAILDKFNAQSSTTEVALSGWPFAQYVNQVLTGLEAGTLTDDLLMSTPDLAVRLFRNGYFLPLTANIKAAGVTPNPKIHAYLTNAAGAVHGVSIVTVNFGLLYNSALFKKAKLKPATTPEELVSTATALTKKPNQYGFWHPNIMAEEGDFWFNLQNWVNMYDGVWAKGKKPLANSPAVVKSLQLWLDLYNAAIPKGINNAAATQLASAGRIAQGFWVSAAVNVLKSTNPAVYSQLRSVPLPHASHKAASRVHPISLNKLGKNKANADEFLNWLFLPDNMADLTIRCLDFIPPFPEMAKVPAFKAYLKDLPWISGFLTPPSVPITPMDMMGDFITKSDEYGHIILTNFQGAINKKVTVKKAMDTAQKQLLVLATKL
jgi:ABC-type glycerol-3-phosphate transport system substrate-binding protein